MHLIKFFALISLTVPCFSMDNEDFNNDLGPRNWVQETRETVAKPFDYVADISQKACDTIWKVETAFLGSPHLLMKILGGLGVIPTLAITTVLTPLLPIYLKV